MERITINFDYDYIEDKYGNACIKAQSMLEKVADSFRGDSPLSLERSGYDYMVLTGEGDRSELKNLIENRFKSTLNVESLEGIILDIQFWLNDSDLKALAESEDWPEELKNLFKESNERIINEFIEADKKRDCND